MPHDGPALDSRPGSFPFIAVRASVRRVRPGSPGRSTALRPSI